MRYKKFSINHLKKVLDELGVSERELCKRMRGQDTHSRIQEIFPPNFRHQRLIDLANALDVPIDTLLEVKENKTDIPNVSGNHNNLQGMLVNSQSIDKSESFLTSDAASDVAFLQKENEYLKKLIEEKERLIKVLLAGH